MPNLAKPKSVLPLLEHGIQSRRQEELNVDLWMTKESKDVGREVGLLHQQGQKDPEAARSANNIVIAPASTGRAKSSKNSNSEGLSWEGWRGS